MRAGIIELPASRIPAMWLPYVRVRDCQACVAQAQALGAQRVVVAPAEIRDVGSFAVLSDPLGATIGVMQLD
jgi:predicted enzyme related to lactoylglutathione lyase